MAEEPEKYSSWYWRKQSGVLTPWEGGPAWRIGERQEHQVKDDGVKDKHLYFYGPVKPGVCVARTVRMSALLSLMPAACYRHSAC